MDEPAATTEPAVAARRRVGILDRPVVVLAAAATIHIALFVGLLLTQVYPHDRWYFPSDDQNRYYGFAKGIGEGHPVPQPATIGYDLFLVPFAAATDFVLQAIPPVALTQL